VPEAQLDDLTLTRLQAGQDGPNQSPEFGFPPVTVDVGPAVGRLGDHTELRGHGRVRRLADPIRRLAGRVGQLAHRIGLLIAGR
jgi:hypothetical protein